MLKKPASFVLRNLGASTYLPCTPLRQNSLRPCWAGFLSIVFIVLPFGVHAANIETYYAPENLPGDRLVTLYDHARRYIYVAVYTITFPPIVKALIEAKKRGVDVRVITDRGQGNDQKQQRALVLLHSAGIPIRVNQHDGLMHLKQVAIDDEINTTGSMNQTTSGHRYNDERLDVIADRAISIKARDKFLAMWDDQARYEEWME
jgi:phosphatidylserine/phosphatidylglycerophosphate/cardiolipin synthase-like enzyme